MAPPRMNPRIQLYVRNAECDACRMCSQADGRDLCVTASGSHEANVLVVSKMPWSERSLKEIQTYLERAGFDLEQIAYTSAIKCRTWDMDPNKTDIKACRQYLDRELEFIKPGWVLALGNEALLSTTGKSGIMKHRGIPYDGPHGTKVVPTISPSMVHRNPGQKAGFEADLLYFLKLTQDRDVVDENEVKNYRVADSKAAIKEMIRDISDAHGVSFDIETTGFTEFEPDAQVVCVAFTLWGEHSETPERVWALPLYHPESPWRSQWRKVLKMISRFVETRAKRVAHNGKFDCRWLRQFGWDLIDVTFDTMLAAHVLDENRPKGLEPLSRTLLNAPPWKIDTKDLVNDPLEKVLLYCARDTWNTARLYFILRKQLAQEPKKARLFARLVLPAANEFIPCERAGVWVDRPVMESNWRIAQAELAAIEEKIREFVPEEHPFKVYYKSGELKSDGVNFNPSNFLRWLIFEYLELPIIARGKQKDDGSPGDPSLAEAVMLALRGTHPIVDLLLERVKWNKYCTSFFSAYAEQLDVNSRIHTNFKVTGTVTGRLSSGKADDDKVTSRKQNRGVNLQQVPRDKFVRGIFGAPPGSAFVEFDYSQIELRIAAQLAQEQTMLSLYAQGQDIHMAMAMRMTGKPKAEVSTHERKMAKAVNFGFLYGMGWKKFVMTALTNYGLAVSEEDAQAARTAFFAQFPQLLPWHARQRALARKYKRVETPLGRVRHLPDIDSPDNGVRAEAERQAINSPVQGLASDLALLSFVLVSRRFRKVGLRAHAIGTVHDAVNFEIPNEELPTALPLIKNIMENPPLERLFGIHLDVPIVADAKVGTRWGGAKELTPEQVYNFDLSILEAA